MSGKGARTDAKTIVLGCTGGIGAGKSRVCKFFAAKGIPVYDSDYRTKELYAEDKQLLNGLQELLGSDIVKEGQLQKQLMASRIFNDSAMMQRVREFVYPFVMRDFKRWTRGQKRLYAKNNNGAHLPFVIMESAVILESEYVKKHIDKVLLVTAPLSIRIERIMARDNCTRKEASERINSQWSDSERIPLADFVIESVEGNNVEAEVDRIYKLLCAASKNC